MQRLNADERSWWLLQPGHPLRVRLQRLTGHPAFGKVVMFLVFANCIAMACEVPACTGSCRNTTYSKVRVFWGVGAGWVGWGWAGSR